MFLAKHGVRIGLLLLCLLALLATAVLRPSLSNCSENTILAVLALCLGIQPKSCGRNATAFF